MCCNPGLSAETVIEAFEGAIARCFNANEAIVVSSGTAAIHCALASVGIGPGDEVLVPSLSVIMSVVPVLYQGATPVFVDSAENRVDFDYEDLEKRVTNRTKAIMPVYLWGCSYNLDRLMSFASKYQLTVIEDACQAHGSRYANRHLGTWGTLGCFSLQESKLISTGEGGFILTNDKQLAKYCRNFRNHNTDLEHPKESHTQKGWNYRLSSIQAKVGLQEIEQFSELLVNRRRQSQSLIEALSDITCIKAYEYLQNEDPNYFSPLFLIYDHNVDTTIAFKLANEGVENSVGTHGLRPVHQWPLFEKIIAEKTRPTETHVQDFLKRVIAPVILRSYSDEDIFVIINNIRNVLVKGNI